MLNYPILRKKPTITIYRNGEKFEMLDLLSDVYKSNPFAYGNTFRVTEYYVARPDLISYVSYGTDEYGDLICKINGISNPFELNENMLVFVPLIEFLGDMVKVMGARDELISPKSKLNSNGMNDNIFKEFSTSLLSNNRLKAAIEEENLKTKKTSPVSTIGKSLSTTKKLKNEKRSPAEQTVDDNNFVVDRSLGVVIY